MRYLRLSCCLFAGLLSALATSAALAAEEAAAPSVDEIVAKANCTAYYQGEDGRAQVAMTITDKEGRTRAREFIILRRDVAAEGQAPCGDQKLYVYFERPADVNKMAYMVWKQVDKDDDRWLYLPALDLVKRIAASDKRTSFVGSDFYYEDVSGRNTADDTHELAETTADYFVLKNVPRDPAAVEFSYYLMYIHRATFIPVQAVFFDKNGEKYRQYTATKVETIQGFPTVTAAKMEDLRTGSITEMSYSDVKYDLGLPDEIFSERYLRKPPRQYLR